MIALKMMLLVMGLFTITFANSIPKSIRIPMSLREYSREFLKDDIQGYKETIKGGKSVYSLNFIFSLLFYVKDTIIEFITSFFILRYPKLFLVLTGIFFMSIGIIIHYYF